MGSYITGHEHRCPICDRKFIPTNEWAYRTKTRLFCSWHFLRESEKNRNAQYHRLTDDQKMEILSRLREQQSCREIADTMGVPIKTVHYVRRILY